MGGLPFLSFDCSPDCETELYDSATYSATISQDEGVFSIGDTLKIGGTFLSEFSLESSGQNFNNSNGPISFGIRLFEGVPNKIEVIPARDNFTIAGSGEISLRPVKEFEIYQFTNCQENHCDLELELIPNKTGYYGFSLDGGNLGLHSDCQSISLTPERVLTNGNNNFMIFNEIGISSIRLNSFYKNPELEERFYFFKVE